MRAPSCKANAVEQMDDESAAGAFRACLLPVDPLIKALRQSSETPASWNSFLKGCFDSPQFRRAITFSSSAFSNELDRCSGFDDLSERAKATLAKYAIRAHWRATPFGLFSGVGVLWPARSGTDMSSTIGEIDAQLRLDRGFLAKAIMELQRLSIASGSLIVRSNPNRAAYDSSVRLLRFGIQQISPEFTVEEIECSGIVSELLDFAEIRRSVDECCNFLVRRNVELGDAQRFVRDLVDAGGLLAVPVRADSTEYEGAVAEFLQGQSGRTARNLESALERIVNPVDLNTATAIHDSLQLELCEELSSCHQERLLQVDSRVMPTSKLRLADGDLPIISNAVRKLFELSPPLDDLFGVRNRLIRRFGTSTVPILKAFDPIEGVDLRDALTEVRAPDYAERREAILGDMLVDWGSSESGVLRLNDEALAKLCFRSDIQLPPTFFALTEKVVVDQNREATSILMAGGTPAGRIAARFGGLFSALDDKLQSTREVEQRHYGSSETVELLYSHYARAGNVTRRKLKKDELSLCIAGADDNSSFSLSLGDIGVRVSIDERSISLVRLKDGKQLTPLATTALNAEVRGVAALYTFLCRLQFQSCPPLVAWNWGTFSCLPHLPRVEFDGVVLTKAQWRLSESVVKRLADGSPSANYQLLERLQVPNLVAFARGDKELLLNLACPELVRSLLPTGKAAVVTEFLAPAAVLTSGPDKERHRCEALVISTFDSVRPSSAVARVLEAVKWHSFVTPRTHFPGDPWASFKIYCNAAAQERLLADIVSPICEELFDQGKISSWFFVKYRDEEDHIRLRLLIADVSNVHDIAYKVARAIHGQSEVWRFDFDTYIREIERYGGESCLRSFEQLFMIDSKNACKLFSDARPTNDGRAIASWLIHIMRLLSLIDVKPEQFASLLGTSFGRQSSEWTAAAPFLREHERTVRSSLKAEFSQVVEQTAFEQSLQREWRHASNFAPEDALLSLIHMSYNRHWGTEGKLHERKLYLLALRVLRGIDSEARSMKATGSTEHP